MIGKFGQSSLHVDDLVPERLLHDRVRQQLLQTLRRGDDSVVDRL